MSPKNLRLKRSVDTELACGSETNNGFELTTPNMPYLVQSPNFDGTTFYEPNTM
jgi:hypothetical protein